MFDFAWSEIALIAGVALVVIGPKDLPVAIRAISGFIKKARRMAGEFQTHVDEMVSDPDRSLRDTFSGNPLEPVAATSTGTIAMGETAVSEPVPDEYGPDGYDRE